VKKTRVLKSKNIVGERVRRARLAMNPTVSQDDLCGKLAREGVVMTQTAVSKLENGERYVMDYEVAALSKVLRVGISWMYSEPRADSPISFE
jgi:transcriptional regulator with XRE-family HTH domain